MSKESGLGMTVAIDDSIPTIRQIENDITSITFSTPQGLQDITGLDKSAMERLILLSDGQVNVTGVWNPAAAPSIFAVFKTRTTVRTFTVTAQLQLANGTVPVWS